MSNLYAPPQSSVANTETTGVDIDGLSVSDTWKARFHLIKRAGGPRLTQLKTLSKKERRKAFSLNILAFFFGPVYYLTKGMWRQALSLTLLCMLVIYALGVAGVNLDHMGLGVATGILFGMKANLDYYRKMVLCETKWL